MSIKGSYTTADYVEFDKALNVGLKLLRSGKHEIFGLYIVVAINTGLRASDLLKLTWEQVSTDELRIVEQKTDKKRLIKLNDHIKRAFNHFETKEGYLFKSSNTVYTIQHLNRVLKEIFAKEAKQHNISTHSLRKSFGRRVYDSFNQSESALVYLSELFNHSNLKITRKYLGIRQQELNDIYLSL